MVRLQQYYKDVVVPKFIEKLGVSNVHAVPKLTKIVISMGVGRAVQERKRLDEAVQHLGMISGQKPVIRKSRIAVSAFRLRENMEVGCCVTLRSGRMYEFLERFIMLALPRVRDFRGLKAESFDGRGNYSTGLQEQMVFPEIPADKVQYIQGMNLTFVTSAQSDEVGRLLLTELGVPFRRG